MKPIFFSIAALLIAYGWTTNIEIASISGAVLYLVALLIDFVILIKDSKKYKIGTLKVFKKSKTNLLIYTRIIEAVLMFSGLFAMMSKNNQYRIPGTIIWIGTITIYFIGGTMVKNVTNLPLKMGYGGWYISRFKKNKK